MPSHAIIEDIAVRESGGDLLFLLPPTPYNKDTPIYWEYDKSGKRLLLSQNNKKIGDTFVDDDNAEKIFSAARSVIIIETDDEGAIGGINQYSHVRRKTDQTVGPNTN
ncbi:hypothetical protein AA14337_3252 [Acetobacter malorum DSM 14337]|uniref:Uncharacterized protein n=1 Tax=Acetobacter malorum DSM 14337 TaxID=1307910 RepID=A0ABQ0Q0G5_9PROT|nr:hypothetical protein [Acetobacter malorum]KXV09876.1 hypothetical protein AD930_02300 [Acetobacter malorum]GBQ86145.1 hypothetical protein AA14337_3252 [Acetobacter malorum DSM 14337]